MWTRYGKNSQQSISIGFKHSAIKSSAKKTYYFPVLYDENVFRQLIWGALDQACIYCETLVQQHPVLHFAACLEWIVKNFQVAIVGLPIFLKQRDNWEIEEEHRVFLLPGAGKDGIDHRNQPCYNFNIPPPTFVHKKYQPFLPITEVYFGGDVEKSDIEKIRAILDSKGYTDIPMICSNVF